MLQTRITELLNINFPVIQGGMVWTSGWKLASAVSENNCLGLIGSGSMKPELLKLHIQKLKQYFIEKNINKPFGVNIPLMRADVHDLINVVILEKIKIVFTSAGNPKLYTKLLLDNDVKVIHVVPSVKFALKAQDAGCNAVVAEGFEAGGHNGFDEITTLCLVPQVVDELEIPVIAAGGIADGRQVLAAFALGAEAVQIGSLFAATHEASSSINFKQKIVEAKDDSTILIKKKLGPTRMFKNKFALEFDEAEKSGASVEELITLLGKKRERDGIFEGDIEEGELEMGQSSGLINEIKSVQEVICKLIDQYNKIEKKLFINK
jgi:enoyl-[acyl-carrier protein] reductase II